MYRLLSSLLQRDRNPKGVWRIVREKRQCNEALISTYHEWNKIGNGSESDMVPISEQNKVRLGASRPLNGDLGEEYL